MQVVTNKLLGNGLPTALIYRDVITSEMCGREDIERAEYKLVL